MNFSTLIPSSMLLSVFRHVLTTAGGGLVVAGHIDEATLQAGVGAVMVLAGIVMGLLNAKKPKAED